MAYFEVTIKQTIVRVVKVETFDEKSTLAAVRSHVEAYGVAEAFSDYPEDENKGSIETKITSVGFKRGI